MKLTKDRPKTEIREFAEFVKEKRDYSVSSNGVGEITSCETKDQKIIAWLKKKGFYELQS